MSRPTARIGRTRNGALKTRAGLPRGLAAAPAARRKRCLGCLSAFAAARADSFAALSRTVSVFLTLGFLFSAASLAVVLADTFFFAT
jgi:hypothetical protein